MYLGSSTRPAAIRQLSSSCSATSPATEVGSSLSWYRPTISGWLGLISIVCGGSSWPLLDPALACSYAERHRIKTMYL